MTLTEAISAYWGWSGLQPLRVAAVSKFGNVMVADTQGKFWRICPEDAYCRVVASDRAEVEKLAADPDFISDWELPGLYEAAVGKFGQPEEGYFFTLRVPGVLGGAYDVSNVMVAPLGDILQVAGDTARRIADLPDGAQVNLAL